MSVQLRSVLKTWFAKGKQPTGTQFSHWIDSFYHKSEDSIPSSSISGLQSLLDEKVNSVTGKGLSTNDYTDEEKAKLAAIDEHYKGTYVSLDSLNAAITEANAGDYAIIDAGEGSDAQKAIWDTSDSTWIIGSGGTVTAMSQERFSLIGHTSIPTAFSSAASIIGVPKFTNLTAVKLVNSDDDSEIAIVTDSVVADLPIAVAAGDYTYELTYESGYEQGVLLINFEA